MSQPTTVEKDRVVFIHYLLQDDEGNVIDMSGAQGFPYLHGHGNMVAGLERQLEGRAIGDEVEAVVPPEEGYGVFKEGAYESVHRRDLPKGAKIEAGAPIRVPGGDGQPITLWITKVQGARVTITTNHPLAGKTLHFKVQIAAIRAATPEELAHGHVHEPGSHHH